MVGWFDDCIERKRCEYMQKVADELSEKYDDIHFYNIDWDLDLLTEGGCNNHPNVAAHEKAFQKIMDAGFERDTGWSPVDEADERVCKVRTGNSMTTSSIAAIVLGSILILIIIYSLVMIL